MVIKPKSYKVHIDNLIAYSPTRADHLLKVPREHLLLSTEDQWCKVEDPEYVKCFLKGIATRDDREVLDYSGLVCDACNEPLMSSYIWCLILNLHSWGALCEKCKQNYKKLPEYALMRRSNKCLPFV